LWCHPHCVLVEGCLNHVQLVQACTNDLAFPVRKRYPVLLCRILCLACWPLFVLWGFTGGVVSVSGIRCKGGAPLALLVLFPQRDGKHSRLGASVGTLVPTRVPGAQMRDVFPQGVICWLTLGFCGTLTLTSVPQVCCKFK
jgi:hypothetical protein